MKRLIYLALIATCWMGHAQTYIDANGREWMRVDNTFSFASLLPTLCSPTCSGIVTQYDYDVRLNSFKNPRSISLDGWRWASKDDVQALMNSIDIMSLGVSQQFVTTYSYSASLYGSTSTVDEASQQRNIAYAYSGHNMVSFDYGSGFLLGVSSIWSGARIGGFLYRSRTEAKNCVYNGKVLLSGESFTAFKAATVAYNQTCQSEVRTCTDGVLSGTFTASACQVNAPLNCTFNGQTILHGQTVVGYTSPTARSLNTYGTFCSNFKVTRTCVNGSLGGTLYPSCQQTTLDPNRCRIKDGAIKCKS